MVREVILDSEVINQKKQLLFTVKADKEYVYPNKLFYAYVYIKNVSGTVIENLHLTIANPSAININSEESRSGNLGDLKNNESIRIKVPMRCSVIGIYDTNFLLSGDLTGLYTQVIRTICSLNPNVKNVEHEITVYNFQPYEDSYKEISENYNSEVTQTIKYQHKPWKYREHPHNMIKTDDDSNEIFVQDQLLKNKHEHPFTYLDREKYNVNILEKEKGANFLELVDKINKKSEYINIVPLRIGNNEMELNFDQLNPDGFIYRFGLLSSEIYHRLGVIPTYDYMVDKLFRWEPIAAMNNIYPKINSFNWDDKFWAGIGFYVYEYKDGEKPLEVGFFERKETAESFIKRKMNYNAYNSITGYTYDIKEMFFDSGVTFINIPIDDIPSNFYLLNQDEIEAIIERCKPFGLKMLLKYKINRVFDHSMDFEINTVFKPQIKFTLPDLEKILYFITPKKFDDNFNLIPDGKAMANIRPQIIDAFFTISKYGPKIVNKKDNSLAAEIQINEIKRTSNKITQNLATTGLYTSAVTDIVPLLYFKQFYFNKTGVITPHYFNDTNINLALKKGDEENSFLNLNLNEADGNIQRKEYPINVSDFKEFKTLAFENSDNKLNGFGLTTTIIPKEIEEGIYVLDNDNNYNLLSYIYDQDSGAHIITHSYIKNGNTKVLKQIKTKCLTLNFEFYEINNKTLLALYYKGIKDEKLHYFNHIVIDTVNKIGVFLNPIKKITHNYLLKINSENKNERRLFYYANNYDDIYISENKDSIKPLVRLEPPQYDELFEAIDNYSIFEDNDYEKLNSTKLYRINNDKESYALIENKTAQTINANKFYMHFDDFNIPDDAEIKEIKLNGIVTSNTTKKDLKIATKTNTNAYFGNEKFSQILNYKKVEFYKVNKNNKEYLENKLEEYIQNDNQKQIEYYKKLIKEFDLFNDMINSDSLSFRAPYWAEFSQFSSSNISLTQAESVTMHIKGYNYGEATILNAHLLNAHEQEIKIPEGYFDIKVKIPFNTENNLNDIVLKLIFPKIIEEVVIYNLNLNVLFKNKIEDNIVFNDFKDISLSFDEKNISTTILTDVLGEDINNGLTVCFDAGEFNSKEYLRIYVLNYDILFREKTSEIITKESGNAIISGVLSKSAEITGSFFNELPTYTQPNFSKTEFFELEEKVYQSFIAIQDNISSISIAPNSFFGEPDDELKLQILTDRKNMPDKVIKEVYIKGWGRNRNLIGEDGFITFDCYTDKLTEGKQYWFALEILNKKNGSGYYLKAKDQRDPFFKCLYTKNGDIKNYNGALMYITFSKNQEDSFRRLPHLNDQIENPHIKLKVISGEVKSLRIKNSDDAEDENATIETPDENDDSETFSHNISFSKYSGKLAQDILDKYEDTEYEPDVSGICTKVIDGDTIDVDGIGRVRFVGVNTPEVNIEGYETSKKFVNKLCYGKTIGLKIDSEKNKDVYDRTLAVVIVDNKNLNEILLKEGLAEIMYIPPSEFNPYIWV